jgi:NSS family neurotransmitter:Na+ symporter
MPSLFILLFLLFVRAIFLPGFGQAVAFLFTPDTSKLTWGGVLEAVGHSFFTLSLGMGAMITYGSYLKKQEDLTRTAITVALLDTFIALAAGIVIFSIVFTFNLEPGSGPTLMFQTLPVLFAKMTGGYVVAVAFFALVAFAAFTSAVSLLEVVVTYWVDTHRKSRKATALIAGGMIYLLGILTVLSTNILAETKVTGLTFFDLFDKLTSSVFLPLGGLIISLFFGWILGPKAALAVVGKRPGAAFLATALVWLTRLVGPVALAFMLVNGLRHW